MNEPTIEQSTQVLLQYSEEDVLVRTIWALSAEQKRSHLFKQLGEQRYLSALRAGAIDNAEMTKIAFSMDPYFLKSKVVIDAAVLGYWMQKHLGHEDAAAKIKTTMAITDDLLSGIPNQIV